MIKKRLKGFSLIEIIVVISISSIILSSLFYLFSNINILNKFTTVKTEKSIEFAYFYHLIRNDLSKILPDNIIGTQDNGKRLDPKSYYEELTQHSINLSLNGSAEICHRDIEILSTRSALIRPILNQKFKNELIEGVHYLGFEPTDDPEKMAKDIISLYEKLKNNSKLLEEVSENGYKWYLENGSIQKNADIILEQLNLELIK